MGIINFIKIIKNFIRGFILNLSQKAAKEVFNGLLCSFLISAFVLQNASFAAFTFLDKKFPLAPIKTVEKIDYVNMQWWNNFNDPYLTDYILKAVNCNHDSRQASWKTEEYRQFVKYQFGQELPSISVAGYYDGVKFPDSKAFDSVKNNIFLVPLTASYEADIFLKNKDKTKSSKKNYEAEKFDEKATYISLVTNTATVYFNIVKFDKQIALQNEIVLIEKEKFRREQSRFNRGIVSATSLNNAKKEYQSAQNRLEELIKAREKSLFQLAVLTGDSPCNTGEYKRSSFDSLEYGSAIPSEICSDVIFSRPDILAAEARLQKANIDVRVARKEFLPKFNIAGLFSLSNLGAGGFGSWESVFAAIIANASIDLFDGGMKAANLKMNRSRYQQMFEAYQQADLIALKEVNDSLIMIRQDLAIDKNTVAKLKTQKDNFLRSNERFKSGVISYPDLLTEKQALYILELDRVDTKTLCLVDYLTLYKAVGGKL